MAAAALARMRAETELMPATSTTEAASSMSLAPTIGRVSPAAIVDTISLGTPTGSARMASAAIEVLPDPPAASTPSQRPSAYSRSTTAVAPRAIASTAWPRSPAARSASTSAPAAAPTSSRVTSGSTSGGPMIPASTRIVRDARRVQAIAQECVLAALRVQRAHEHDGLVCHLPSLAAFQGRRYRTRVTPRRMASLGRPGDGRWSPAAPAGAGSRRGSRRGPHGRR